jgi:hypothetical protein
MSFSLKLAEKRVSNPRQHALYRVEPRWRISLPD